MEKLREAAVSQVEKAYAPYSEFQVGAALLTEDGRIYTGCNIENAAYTPTICAERTAFFKAVSEGERAFKAICIAGGKQGVIRDFTPPCGVCRQVMMEFADPDKFQIILTNGAGDLKVYTLRELLPAGFGPEEMKDE